MVRIFDIENGVLTPTEHCYTLASLKAVMDTFPEDHLKIYLYVFYMTCPNPKQNPFFDVVEEDKEELILKEIGITISMDHPVITTAHEFCTTLFSTPTSRAYEGFKIFLDNLSTLMKTDKLTTGKDGSVQSLVSAAVKWSDLRESFKGVYHDLLDEQNRNRGDSYKAYDQ